ncbi:MAG: prephenate dehydratase [Victivallales bacterium]|nr:prephenate dehydratase [Victivallales bacterium]
MTGEPRRVAIQGIQGSFHDIAARQYFGDEITIVPCTTFAEQFAALDTYAADTAMMAIENSVAGSILSNYSLVRSSRARIVGEIYLRIAQNLMALPGQRVEDITEVRSHPMAINQSRVWFDAHPHIRLVEWGDTASSAKVIADEGLMGVGAIASELAAEMYGLELLGREIETNKRNYTRFLILSEHDIKGLEGHPDKASLCFSLPHQPGSLARALSILSYYDVDLSKIQSLPIIGREWQYLFYIDLAFDDPVRYRQALSAMRPLTETFEELGEYQRGRRSFEQVHHAMAENGQ